MNPTTEVEAVQALRKLLQTLQPEIIDRNDYMNTRDRYVYGDGLWENLEIPDGFDRTTYNFLSRVVDIHASQLMGRGFQIYSNYDKEDVSAYTDPGEMALAELKNKKLKADADARKHLVDAIIRDNGGDHLFKQGAIVGAAYGTTIYKMWFDQDEKKIRIQLIESPQNFWAGWSDTNFRERDFDAFVYQISAAQAYRQYGDLLKDSEDFEFSKADDPLLILNAKDYTNQNIRKMVTVMELTGYLEGWGATKDGKLKKVERGQETKLNLLVVGGKVAQVITEEDKLPKYYIIRNREVPRRPWGNSDLPTSALEINATYLERMSDYITLVNKTLFPMIQAKGFETGSIPKKKQRQMVVVPMTPEQSLDAVQMPTAFGFEYNKLLEELKESFVKITGIGRVLFDDPSINPSSNQALMTTLKGVIDIVEAKQSLWEPILTGMFTDALDLTAKFLPDTVDIIQTDDDWHFYVVWPSVLRREDATYQQIWLNLFNAGAVSLDTYLEKVGIEDTSEEIDRLRDNMKDPVTAAVLGKQLPLLAQQAIVPPAPVQPQLATPQAANPTLTTDQNTGQTASQPGSGAPAVSPEGAINQVNQNLGL